MAFNGALTAASAFGKISAHGFQSLPDVNVQRNIEYTRHAAGAECLDVYRPRDLKGPAPVVLYVHGGAFCTLSKDTHWMAALGFARAGCVVVSINHRMSPKHAYPAALEDAAAALEWMQANSVTQGFDLSNLILAGDSSGANIATVLAIATSYRLSEPFAQRIFATGLRPLGVMPVSGTLDMTWADSPTAQVDPLARGMYVAYLGPKEGRPPSLRLADPLRFLESAPAPERPLPNFFIAAGTTDPLRNDSRRLADALQRLDVSHQYCEYEGFHAPHLLWWRPEAKRYWCDARHHLEHWKSGPRPAETSTEREQIGP